MFRRKTVKDWHYPVAVWLYVLGAVLLTEFTVMQALPWILPAEPTRALDSAVDAIVLSLLLAPILWWTVVRPMREVVRLRTKFLGDLFAAIEVDRRQTARELHDGVGQELTLLISGLRSAHEAVAHLDVDARCLELLKLAQTALTNVKRLALGLRPSLLDDLGLLPAVDRLVADVMTNHRLEITLEARTMVGVRLPEPVETAVFRIIQEALANIIRHSGAKRATIEMHHGKDELFLIVTDDGCGFQATGGPAYSPSSVATKSGKIETGHIGLIGMRERIALLGGSFHIETAPGQGCRLTAAIPTGGEGSE